MEFDDPGGPSEEHGQDPRCEWVERPAVSDALGGGQTPDEPDDVVRRRADRLVDDQDPVESGTQ